MPKYAKNWHHCETGYDEEISAPARNNPCFKAFYKMSILEPLLEADVGILCYQKAMLLL